MKIVRKGAARKTPKAPGIAKIREALAYWKGRMAQLNEAEEAVDTVDEARQKALDHVVDDYNMSQRIVSIHEWAVEQTKNKVSKMLQNQVGVGDVDVINSWIDSSERFHPPAKPSDAESADTRMLI